MKANNGDTGMEANSLARLHAAVDEFKTAMLRVLHVPQLVAWLAQLLKR